MKISGKFIAKVAGTLTVISLVVAALLGLVNSVTADKIDAINEENTKIALSAVTEEGSTFEPVEVSEAVSAAASVQGGTIEEMYAVTTNGAAAGYAIKLTASGSQGNIEMVVGVDASGSITGISIVSNSETAGIGSKVMSNLLDQFIGQSGAGSLKVGKNITAISGATVSTRGVNMGANAALAAVEALG